MSTRKKKKTEPERNPLVMETWDEHKRLKALAEELSDIIAKGVDLSYDLDSPRARLEELKDEIYGQPGGEAKWGCVLDPLYKWVDYAQDHLAEEGPLDTIRDRLRDAAEELTYTYDGVVEEFKGQVSDLAKAQVIEPIPGSDRREDEQATTLEDLHKVTAHAVELVKYLDGDAALVDVDTDDLRYRLRRLGFSVALS